MMKSTEPIEDEGEILVDGEKIETSLSDLIEGVESLGKYGDARIVGTLMIRYPEILAEMIESVRRTHP